MNVNRLKTRHTTDILMWAAADETLLTLRELRQSMFHCSTFYACISQIAVVSLRNSQAASLIRHQSTAIQSFWARNIDF